MKAVLILVALLAVVALSSAVYSETDGKPVCTEINVATGKFRDNFDPTRYWLCSVVRSEAQEILCPDQTAFLDSKKECVPWADWIWEEPYDPPTE